MALDIASPSIGNANKHADGYVDGHEDRRVDGHVDGHADELADGHVRGLLGGHLHTDMRMEMGMA